MEPDLVKLAAEIARIEATCERMEKLGLTSISSGGTSRNFADYTTMRNRLSRLRHRLSALSDGLDPKIIRLTTVIKDDLWN